MKKALLVIAYTLAAIVSTFGQTFDGTEKHWSQNWNTSGSVDCASNGYIGNMYNNGFVNTNFNSAPSFSPTQRATIISSSSTINTSATPGWNGFLYNDGVYCNFIRNVGGVDLSSPGDGKLSIIAKASTEGAVLHLYLGTTGSVDWMPASSTYDYPIIAEFTLTTSYASYTFDYEAANAIEWTAWAGKSTVNQWGFDPQTPNTDFYIQEITIGTIPTPTNNAIDNNAINIYPNPASIEVTIDFIGMDLNGAVAKLINANGVIVFEGPIGSTLPIAGYNKGIYMLQVTSGNKMATKKLVIQ
jgi:hypothetical protein